MNLLEEAAYTYGQCKGQLESAFGCGMPEHILSALYKNKQDAEDCLRQAAIQYFHNTYDGSEHEH